MELNSSKHETNLNCDEEVSGHTGITIQDKEGISSCIKEELESKEEIAETTGTSDNREVSLNTNLSEDNTKHQSATSIHSIPANNELTPDENVVFSFSCSQDKLTIWKKNPKTNKIGELNESFPLLTKLVMKSFLPQNSLKDSQSNRKLYEIYPNPDKLCDDCLWLVKATKSSESMKSSSEDEDFVAKWIESKKSTKIKKEDKIVGKKSTELVAKDCRKDDVIKLLNEVHSTLLECNIILTTQKLQKKLRKSVKDDEVISEMSLCDDLFDQIQAEEDTKEGASKLCLVLERLVSRYLKCCVR